jgi:hypothetical protein
MSTARSKSSLQESQLSSVSRKIVLCSSDKSFGHIFTIFGTPAIVPCAGCSGDCGGVELIFVLAVGVDMPI